MNRPWKIIACLAAVSVAGALGIVFAGERLLPEVTQDVSLPVTPRRIAGTPIGSVAPAFALEDVRGEGYRSETLLGTPYVLLFWATWNQTAADALKVLDEFLATRRDLGVTVLAIAHQEDRSVIASFVNRGGYRLPILLDATGALGERYRVRVLPTVFLVDRHGILRDVVVGPIGIPALVEKTESILR